MQGFGHRGGGGLNCRVFSGKWSKTLPLTLRDVRGVGLYPPDFEIGISNKPLGFGPGFVTITFRLGPCKPNPPSDRSPAIQPPPLRLKSPKISIA